MLRGPLFFRVARFYYESCSTDVTRSSILMTFRNADYATENSWAMQHGVVITQDAKSNTVRRKLRCFTLADDERFCHVQYVFSDFFSRFTTFKKLFLNIFLRRFYVHSRTCCCPSRDAIRSAAARCDVVVQTGSHVIGRASRGRSE